MLGRGAFGAALAEALRRGGRAVALVGREPDPALARAEAVLVAVPTQALRGALRDLPGAGALALCCKGLERETMRLPAEIAAEAAPGRAVAVLSGPCFAADLAAGRPAAMTLACADKARGAALQQALSTERLRLYRSDDLVGVQLGGALKNVIAIACGAAEGLGFGESARAALVARGFAELRRMAAAAGGRAETVSGLSGLGDLALTCGSAQSRNFRYGRALTTGETVAATVEGREAAGAASALAARLSVEAPIIDAVAALASGRVTPAQAVTALLARPLRSEHE